MAGQIGNSLVDTVATLLVARVDGVRGRTLVTRQVSPGDVTHSTGPRGDSITTSYGGRSCEVAIGLYRGSLTTTRVHALN